MNKIKVFNFLILLVLAIFFLNLNGVVYIFTSIQNIFSNLILLIIMLLLGISIQIKQISLIRGYNRYFVMTIFCYFFLGIVPYLFLSNGLDLSSPELTETVKNIIISIVFIFLLFNFFKINDLELKTEKSLKYMTVLFALASLSGVIFKEIGITEFGNYNSITDMRYSGIFANPNELGFYSNISAVFLLYFTFRKKISKQLKYILIILTILSFYNVFLSLSKTALFSSIIILIIYLINFTTNKNFYNRIGVFFIFTLISYLSFQFFQDDLSSLNESQRNRFFFINSIEDNNLGQLTSHRDVLWEHGIQLIASNPFGYGLGFMQNMPGLGGIHNEFLMIMGEAGVLSGILVLILIIKVFIKILNKKDKDEKFLLLATFINIVIYATSTHAIIQKKGILILLVFIFYFTTKKLYVRYIRNN